MRIGVKLLVSMKVVSASWQLSSYDVLIHIARKRNFGEWWNSPSKGYTEENIRMFILAYNKRVVEAHLEIGADCSVLSER